MSAGIERLRTLYAVLGGVPDDSVSLRDWRSDGPGRKEITDSKLLADAQRGHCGTTGCAVGWACAYPEFQAQGLQFGVIGPLYRNQARWHSGWSAVLAFFELDQREADSLFLTDPPYKRFDPCMAGHKGRWSHRRLAMARIRLYLLSVGAITAERNEALAREEGFTSNPGLQFA